MEFAHDSRKPVAADNEKLSVGARASRDPIAAAELVCDCE